MDVCVLCHFLTVRCVDLQFVIVAFPCRYHLVGLFSEGSLIHIVLKYRLLIFAVRNLLICYIDPYKPSVLSMGHQQTVQNQIRRRSPIDTMGNPIRIKWV